MSYVSGVLPFEKYEGLGNDFVLITDGAMTPERAQRICDRHRGVGADGVLVIGERDGAPSMRVFNADGSVPEMCGNGVRCVGLWLRAHERVGDAPFVLHTDAGPHTVRVLDGDLVEVGMRPASLAPGDVPIASDRPWIDEPFAIDGRTLHVTAVSMGNPHAVFFDDVGEARLTLGPTIEVDPRFPEKANVGFATRTERGLELAVWERGVGWTEACGTGACAAAVAAVHTGRAERGVELPVRLPGGELVIRVDGDGEPVVMRGPARRVFSGSF